MDKNIKMTISIGCVALILTMLMFTQFKTVDETDIMAIETMRETELRSELASWKEKYEAVDLELQEREQRISEYKNELNNGANSAELLTSEVKEAESYLGYTEVHGQGIKIILTGYDIHDVKYDHILELINELKNAGAEAISINEQRIISTTSIICGGNTISINGEKIGSPFVIKAIGSPEALANLERPGGCIANLKERELVAVLKKDNDITIPKYSGVLNFKYLSNVD